MRVLLFQTGARHNYALARFLYDAHYLGCLYTDLALPQGSLAERTTKAFPRGSLKSALERRTVAGIPSDRIVNSYISLLRKSVPKHGFFDRMLPHHRWGGPWRIRREDLQADVIVSQYLTGFPSYRQMLSGGTKLVSDVFAMPSTHRIINVERTGYPQWGEVPIPKQEADFYDYVSSTMIKKSHGLFCPSPNVIDDVVSYDSSARAKCYLVPYAAAIEPVLETRLVPGRVFFAGSVTLNKGVHYLKAAADLLRTTNPEIKIVVAGSISAVAREQMFAENVECLGHISKSRMQHELASADVFAFPSLAEGLASVVLEALAAGLPVVTTKASGATFKDGEAGFIVPERDPEKLASALACIVQDRALRDSMSEAARKQAFSYDLSAWSTRFLQAIREVHDA